MVDDRPDFLSEVVPEPHIMVAREEVNLHPSVVHQSDLPQEAYMPLGDYSLVLEPVVKHIA